jgi:membrane-associated phospholipid phosphatase
VSTYFRYQRVRGRVKTLDLAVYRRVRGVASVDTVWVRRFSRLGEHGLGWLALGAGAAVVDRPRRLEWARAAAGVGCCYLLSSSIKWSIARQRPTVEDLPPLMRTPTGLSFPSSHATSSFAAARAYGRLLPRGPLLAAATGMALSRIYLGVHYPSDVLAGAALGTALGSMAK